MLFLFSFDLNSWRAVCTVAKEMTSPVVLAMSLVLLWMTQLFGSAKLCCCWYLYCRCKDISNNHMKFISKLCICPYFNMIDWNLYEISPTLFANGTTVDRIFLEYLFPGIATIV